MMTYEVEPIGNAPAIRVTVPGSKSITNRALLMAAMAEGTTVLSGVLFSDDSRFFIQALIDLGFTIMVEEKRKEVTVIGMGGKIPNKTAKIFVGSAGTAARFLTAFVGMSSGSYRIESSEQMKKRPMAELFQALTALGARVTYLEEEGTFPVEISGVGNCVDKQETSSECIELNIDRSSQFLSALLMVAPAHLASLTIHLTGSRNARSYVEMTEQMMKQFGHKGVNRIDKNTYQVEKGQYKPQNYQIEPDVSAACYFYGAAAITGGTACVEHMRQDSLQGDMKFLQILEKMGCHLDWSSGRLVLTGPEPGKLKGITADLSDFSDQALTLAAIAPYADSPVTVKNVGHIRGQECNRIQAIDENMSRMQVSCRESKDGFTIYPSKPQPAIIETYDDHRVAMAFAITGLGAKGIVISNPQCCKKTFENFFEVLTKTINENKQ